MTLKNTSAILYLGILGTVVGLFGSIRCGRNWCITGSYFTNLVPVFRVVLSFILLGEPVLVSMVIGGRLLVVGVTITNRKPKQAAETVSPQVVASAV